MVPDGSDEREIRQSWVSYFQLYTKNNKEPLKSLKQNVMVLGLPFFKDDSGYSGRMRLEGRN